jgi:hypothetical protein
MSKKCPKSVHHSAVDGVLKDTSPNYVNVNGEKQKMHTFSESFTHHVETEPTEFDPVTDEIRRWSSVSEDECQWFVCVEDGAQVVYGG